MKVLVVGGAGYIGSHTALALRDSGLEPVIYDNFSTGHRRLVRDFTVVEGDLADRNRLLKALRGVDAVMHFAALAYVGESVTRPREYYENNVVCGLSLLNAMVDAGVKRLIFSSTCAVYGTPDRLPITESSRRAPINPYGATKAAFEEALVAYSRAYDLQFVCLRYFNAAGADEFGRSGELHDPETHLIPCILRVAAGLSDVVDVFGTDYDTADGTCVRDFIHVSDLAAAHLQALELLGRERCSEFINVGNGRGYTIGEVLACAEAVTGRPIARRLCARRAGDPATLISSPRYAHERLQWSAKRSLVAMVETAWNFLQRQQESSGSVVGSGEPVFHSHASFGPQTSSESAPS